MKKPLFTILILTAILLCACTRNSGGTSGADREPSAASGVSAEESRFVPEEVYPFLLLEETVTSRRTSSGRKFIYDYYLDDERTVVGARLTTVLQTTAEAREYRNSLLKKHPDAVMDGKAVTVYIDSKSDGYYFIGFPLEKLLYTLDLNGIEYTLNFDENESSEASE